MEGVIGLRCPINSRRKGNVAIVVVIIAVDAAEIVVLRSRGTKILIIFQQPPSRIRWEIPALINSISD
jgi:hypothetical protein